jgi:hypothetical protein
MTLEEILNNWDIDCEINDYLHGESARTPRLAGKYLRELSREKIKLNELDNKYNKLKHEKAVFLSEGPSNYEEQEMYEAKGWKLPPKGKIKVKTELETYLNVDEELTDIGSKICLSKTKIETLQFILKEIQARSYLINNEIEIRKHEHGKLITSN